MLFSVKRLLDILFSLSFLLILIPVFVVIMVIIFLLDFENPFFIQYRVGQFGKLFRLYKFRTMTTCPSTKNGTFDAGDLSRITRFGKFLRKSKLDELPQLINVLKGEMSIVGPRPEVQSWVKVYPERWAIIHSIKPGITDCASIEFRNEEEILSKSMHPYELYQNEILPRKIELYEEYVKNHSISVDVKIIFKTLIRLIIK